MDLQFGIDMAIIKTLKPTFVQGNIRPVMQRFPHPPYVVDQWESVSTRILSIAVFVTFLVYVMSIAKDITTDKETKMRVCEVAVD